MMSTFLPHTTREQDISIALEAMACHRGQGELTYIAVPITGGPRFVKWYETLEAQIKNDDSQYQQALRENVIEPNFREADQAISKLLSREACSVIDPSRLEMPQWSQNDYRHFWSVVIERFASRAIFLDGWHLSNGCIYEFFVTTSLGLPTLDARLVKISTADGIQLIEQGISEFRRIGADVEFIAKIAQELAANESTNDRAY